jgi:pycsar effector protein
MSVSPKEVPPPAAGSGPPFENVKARSSVDNLLRTVQQHHVQLSLMADMKANILITISSILLTIALSRMSDVVLRPALLTLAVACLIALILAIIAILPTFARRKQHVTKNLLFFGHFASMTEEEYFHAMEEMLSTDQHLMEVAVRDIHSLGVYLYRKKYRFLRFAYVALLFGFILATIVEAVFYWRT